jgi:hypothetical protein
MGIASSMNKSKYYPYRFHPKMMSIFFREHSVRLKTGQETKFFPKSEFPTREDMNLYLTKFNGSIIGEESVESWKTLVSEYDLTKLREEFRRCKNQVEKEKAEKHKVGRK